MHTNEGGVDGQIGNLLKDLDQGLSAFAADLGPAFANVTVMLISEFGRTLRQNGATGTDHGHGQPMLVLGGGIKGGKVYGAWPGLDDKVLFSNGSVSRTDRLPRRDRGRLRQARARRIVQQDLPGPQAEGSRAGHSPLTRTETLVVACGR